MDWFVRMNNTGDPVDVWAVDGLNEGDLVESPEGHSYVGSRFPVECLSLIRSDIEPATL